MLIFEQGLAAESAGAYGFGLKTGGVVIAMHTLGIMPRGDGDTAERLTRTVGSGIEAGTALGTGAGHKGGILLIGSGENLAVSHLYGSSDMKLRVWGIRTVSRLLGRIHQTAAIRIQLIDLTLAYLNGDVFLFHNYCKITMIYSDFQKIAPHFAKLCLILPSELMNRQYFTGQGGRFVRYVLLCGLALGSTQGVRGDAFSDYIERYSAMAVAEQERCGIPASITLAQGLLESGAGRSTLAREGNNHFGIKCHAEWQGASMLRSDDAPDECFRVYDTPDESFADHSRFLQRRRYERLFSIPCEDYAAWAHGLKECGYATDPQYADRLITIIERYGLDAYVTGGERNTSETAEFIRTFLLSAHVVRVAGGLHYVVAVPGDTYASIAAELSMDARKLTAYNDALSPDTLVKDWEEVYLQPKRDKVSKDSPTRATIGEDESMHSLSQRFGITLKALRRLNPGAEDRPGTRLRLR